MRFKKVYIEIGNSCNLSCHFCIKNQRVIKQMSIEEFTLVLVQLQPYTKYLYFHVLGEPLLHPHLEEFLKIANQLGFYVNITTNGTLLEKQLDMLINAEALRQVNISVHSFSEQNGPNQEHYLSNIIHSAKELAKVNKYVSLRLWNMRNGNLDNESLSIAQAFQTAFNCKHEIKVKESMKLADHIFLQFDEVFAWPTLEHEHVSKVGTCHGLKQMLGILANGDVVPCCLDSTGAAKMGNIFEECLDNIIQSNYFKQRENERRQGILNEPLCQRCVYRTRFNKEEIHEY